MSVKIAALILLLLPLAAALFVPAVESVLTRIVKLGFVIGATACLPLFLVQFAVVILRSVFSISFIWLQESTLYLFGAMFLLSSGWLLLTEGHVRVDIFYAKMSEARAQLVDLLGTVLFVIPISMLIIYVSWNYVGTSWAQMERSQEASGIHAVFLLKSMVPAFAVLLLFAGEVRIIRLLKGARDA